MSLFSKAIIATTDERHAGPVDIPGDVGRAIEACWHPPRAADQITLRLSFRRDGSVFGKPLVTIRTAAIPGAKADARLVASIGEAVAGCAPLPFVPQFGAEIAGRVFLIRFVAP